MLLEPDNNNKGLYDPAKDERFQKLPLESQFLLQSNFNMMDANHDRERITPHEWDCMKAWAKMWMVEYTIQREAMKEWYFKTFVDGGDK